MLTIANKGRYVIKKCQKPVYVICEGSLMEGFNISPASADCIGFRIEITNSPKQVNHYPSCFTVLFTVSHCCSLMAFSAAGCILKAKSFNT